MYFFQPGKKHRKAAVEEKGFQSSLIVVPVMGWNERKRARRREAKEERDREGGRRNRGRGGRGEREKEGGRSNGERREDTATINGNNLPPNLDFV